MEDHRPSRTETHRHDHAPEPIRAGVVRQLISVVTESSVLFLTHDGEGEAVQIAQVVNSGMGVADVIALGVTLEQALHLNGRAVTRREPCAALPPARPSGLPRGRKPESNPGRDTSGTVAAELVLCPVCKTGYRRSSLAAHLIRVHNWKRDDANRASRARPSLPPDADVPRSTRGGHRGPQPKRPGRPSPDQLWPMLTRVHVAGLHPRTRRRHVTTDHTGDRRHDP